MSIVGTRNRIFFHCHPLPIKALFLATLIKFLTSSQEKVCVHAGLQQTAQNPTTAGNQELSHPPQPPTYSPEVTMSMLFKVTVRESKPHLSLSYLSIAPIFPFPLSLQRIQGSISKGGTVAETPFFLQKHPSVVPTAHRGPASGIMTPWGPEQHRVAAEARTLHILSLDIAETGLLLGEHTPERSEVYFKTHQLWWGNHGFLCSSNIGQFCFWLSLTKKGNTGPQLLPRFSLTQDNLGLFFFSFIFISWRLINIQFRF